MGHHIVAIYLTIAPHETGGALLGPSGHGGHACGAAIRPAPGTAVSGDIFSNFHGYPLVN